MARSGGWRAIPATTARSTSSPSGCSSRGFGASPRTSIESYREQRPGMGAASAARSRSRATPREVVLSREQDRRGALHQLVLDAAGRRRAAARRCRAPAPTRRTSRARTSRAPWCSATAPVGPLWTRAVRERGAAGVISTELARVHAARDARPTCCSGAAFRTTRRGSRLGSRPRRARRGGCASAWPPGPVRVHVDIATTFHRGPNRTLVAEIPGTARRGRARRARRARAGARRQRQRQRLRDAAGRGARDAATRSRAARFRRRARTLTFLWLDEIRGSERWLERSIRTRPRRVVAMMSLDMTGEDTAKTGGTFLIEKSPDPSAIWPRPSDPHSEWGAGEVRRRSVQGPLSQRSAPRRRAAARARHRLGRADQSVRGRQRSHRLHARAACPRSSTGTSPIATTTPISTRVDKTSAGHDGPRRDGRGDDGAVSRVGRSDRCSRADDARGRSRARAARDRTREQAADEILAAWKKWYEEARASVVS